MNFINLSEYISYAIQPIQNNKLIIILSSLFFGIVTSIANTLLSTVNWLSFTLVIHSLFIISYAILSALDWITGLVAGVIVEKQPFTSAKFFKKPVLIMFCLLMLYITVALSVTFDKYEHNDNFLLQGTLHTVIFLFEGIKIGLMVAFFVYELTSLRENFIRLRMKDFADIVDMFLLPFIKIQNYIRRKTDKVMYDDLDQKQESDEKE